MYDIVKNDLDDSSLKQGILNYRGGMLGIHLAEKNYGYIYRKINDRWVKIRKAKESEIREAEEFISRHKEKLKLNR